MNRQEKQISKSNAGNLFGGLIFLTVLSLTALIAAFWLTNQEINFERKLFVFAVIIAVYLIFSALIYYGQLKRKDSSAEVFDASNPAELFDREVENRLFALEEANQFFGASLKPNDMFRLAASRVGELVPFSLCLLWLTDGQKKNLKIAFAEGVNAKLFKNLEFDKIAGLAGRALTGGKVSVDNDLLIEKEIFPAASLENLRAASAVPLVHKGEVFGVLELFGEKNFDANSIILLEAVGERIAPLFVNSMTFEQNISNALTDSLTGLPNERAFFLVLENQIAEAIRFPHERPLTILTIDLKNFTKINQKFGHATGDRILEFAGKIIRHQLRRMDFPARASGDEFLVVLPTANEKTAHEIIARIERDFTLKQFQISDTEKLPISLNFGCATFGRDGETAQRLLAAALLRKQQEKSVEPNKVLWFPKEFVN